MGSQSCWRNSFWALYCSCRRNRCEKENVGQYQSGYTGGSGGSLRRWALQEELARIAPFHCVKAELTWSFCLSTLAYLLGQACFAALEVGWAELVAASWDQSCFVAVDAIAKKTTSWNSIHWAFGQEAGSQLPWKCLEGWWLTTRASCCSSACSARCCYCGGSLARGCSFRTRMAYRWYSAHYKVAIHTSHQIQLGPHEDHWASLCSSTSLMSFHSNLGICLISEQSSLLSSCLHLSVFGSTASKSGW